LQHHIRGRAGSDQLDGTAAGHGHELVGVIVIAGAQIERAQLIGGLGESVGDFAPAIQPIHASGAGHHDVAASQRLVELDRLGQALGAQVGEVVVRRIAADAQIVQQLAGLLGLAQRPGIIRAVELHHLIALPGDGAHGARQILAQLGAHGVEFQSYRQRLLPGDGAGERNERRGCQERPPGEW